MRGPRVVKKKVRKARRLVNEYPPRERKVIFYKSADGNCGAFFGEVEDLDLGDRLLNTVTISDRIVLLLIELGEITEGRMFDALLAFAYASFDAGRQIDAKRGARVARKTRK